MTKQKERFVVWVAMSVFVLFVASTAHAAKLGKIFITAAKPEAGDFADPGLEDTVRDLKRGPGDFEIAANESDADYLLVVVTREELPLSGANLSAKRVTVTLSTSDGSGWKPAIKISKIDGFWEEAARKALGGVQKWVKENQKRR
jgi:hypothetical protein